MWFCCCCCFFVISKKTNKFNRLAAAGQLVPIGSSLFFLLFQCLNQHQTHYGVDHLKMRENEYPQSTEGKSEGNLHEWEPMPWLSQLPNRICLLAAMSLHQRNHERMHCQWRCHGTCLVMVDVVQYNHLIHQHHSNQSEREISSCIIETGNCCKGIR